MKSLKYKNKVLLVEDDGCLYSLWKLIFKKINKEVDFQWAVNIKEASDKMAKAEASHQSFDIVIADVFVYGNETGIDLWKKYQNTTTIFLFCSGLTSDNFKKLFFPGQKIPAFIQKPIDFPEIRKVLNELLLFKKMF